MKVPSTAGVAALVCWFGFLGQRQALAQQPAVEETRVIVESEGWHLVGNLVLPLSGSPVAAVLLLNKAAGDRTVYGELANRLADRGIGSLRLDLRGHGESTNLGHFVPGEQPRSPLIWDAEVDIAAAQRFLTSHAGIDGGRMGVVGGSYSGEEMAEAGRLYGYAQAYVALSPGSFSQESISAIDSSGVPWLFVVSRDERFLRDITARVREESGTVELVVVPGTRHATDILAARPDVAERIAVWLARRLRE